MSRHKNLQRFIDDEEDEYDDYGEDDYDFDYGDEYEEEDKYEGEAKTKAKVADFNVEEMSFEVKEIKLSENGKSSSQNSQNGNSKVGNSSISPFGKCISQKSVALGNNSKNSQQMSLYDEIPPVMRDLGTMKKANSMTESSIKRTDSKTALDALSMKRTDSKASNVSSEGGRKQRKPFDMNLLKQAKDHLNLVIVGHVDAGKSTLVGHLLVLASEIDKKVIQKYERDSQKIGKGSFAYAWVMDENEDERNRGITIEVGVTKLNFPNRTFTLLDSPGHRDFIPNMLSGTAQADVAILVVDAGIGAFESGFESGGQTKEHALLLRSLGISQIIVAVNKLDMVDWSQARYQEISEKLGSFLAQIGFNKPPGSVKFVPCSGLSGENLMKSSSEPLLQSWYNQGPCIADLMNNLEVPSRAYDKPFRATISDFFKGTGSNSIAICARIEAGVLQIQDRLLLMPIQETLVVKSLNKDGENVEWAAAGDIVLITCTGVDIAQMNLSYVLSAPGSPIPASDKFTAQIVTFDIRIPLICGSSLLMYHGSSSEEAVITAIHPSPGSKKIRCIPRNTNAQVDISLKRKICLERYQDYKEFGRFTLRLEGESIGAGIITEIILNQ